MVRAPLFDVGVFVCNRRSSNKSIPISRDYTFSST